MIVRNARLRITLWGVVLIFLGIVLGLKAGDLPTFNAATDSSTQSVSSRNIGVDLASQNLIANSFMQTITDLGDGNAYAGAQKLITGAEVSNASPVQPDQLLAAITERAQAQEVIPVCNSTYQQYVKEGWAANTRKELAKEFTKCVVSIKVTGKLTYTIHKKDGVFYVVLYIENFRKVTTRWVQLPDGSCILMEVPSPLQGTWPPYTVVAEVTDENNWQFVGGVPPGATLICKSMFEIDLEVKNPKFSKEECCGKKQIPQTEQ